MKTIDHKEAVCLVAEGDKVSPEKRQELQNQRLHELVDYAREKTPDKHYFDVHITSDENQINVLMKDDGRPFNPIAKPNADDGRLHIGLQLVNSSSTKMNYRYMYDQNMVFLTVDRNKNH